ncbi:MAG: SpoIID/LytB domain-containing protein [Caloramator sp.]|nr:SpoIID/LytB domain-containing protein [Caloramator sp.]
MKKIKRFLLLILILSGILYLAYYFLFYKETKIDCGIIINFEEKKKNYDIEVFYNNSIKKITIPKYMFNPNYNCYNIKFKGIFIKEANPANQISGIFNSFEGDTIEVERKQYNKASNVQYILYENGKPKIVSKNFFVVGNSGYKYYFNSENKVQLIVIEKPPVLDTIRVGISTNNNNIYLHKQIKAYSKRGLEVDIDGQTYKVQKEDKLQIIYSKSSLVFNILDNKDNLKSKLIETNSIVKISGIKNSPISLEKNSLNNGNNMYIPSYPGIIELNPKKDGFLITNIVSIEDYLLYVVPSEVPYSAGVEGYKAQAVSARTYAISDMLSGRFAKYGFHVDDSTYSQVYNSQPTNNLVKSAVKETENIVMTYNGKIIDAKYYSTSCGFGASYDEVWQEKEQNTKPYLAFSNYTNKEIKDLTDDSTALTFFKDWTIDAVDSSSPYFRWKYTLNYTILNKTINQNIYNAYINSPKAFKKKWIFNMYKKTSITVEGIGQIKDIYVSKHSPSGLVKEIIIVSENGTYKIEGTNIIKRLITPSLEYQKSLKTKIEIQRIRGSSLTEFDSIPSAFFSIDREFKAGNLSSITIYGGGYGHGVGMSQYALIERSRVGENYKTILSTFYKDIQYTNLYDLKIE